MSEWSNMSDKDYEAGAVMGSFTSAPETKGKVSDFKSDVDLSSASEGVASLWRPQPDARTDATIDQIAEEHLAWLSQYFSCMTGDNWRDMRAHGECQVQKLRDHLAAPPARTTANSAEPVAWQYETLACEGGWNLRYSEVEPSATAPYHRDIRPLYAAPPSPATVREAAQAVIDRWETPAWKDRPATATYINALRAALSSAPVAPAAPVAGTPDQWQDIIEQCAKVADTAMTHQHAVHAASIVDRALSDTGRDAIQRDASNRVDEAASIAKSIRALSRNDR